MEGQAAILKPIIQTNLEKLKQLCLAHHVKHLWVFGSVMTDQFNKNSDIDFLVAFEEMSLEDYADNYFLLCDALENLFKRKVDVVTIHSLSNPYFIRSVEKTKRLLYERRD